MPRATLPCEQACRTRGAIASVNTDLLVLGTTLSTVLGPFFEVRHDHLDEPRDAVDYEIVLIPTEQALHDLVWQFGYSVATLEPSFAGAKHWTKFRGLNDYRLGSRRSFLCAKRTYLSRLDTEVKSQSLHRPA